MLTLISQIQTHTNADTLHWAFRKSMVTMTTIIYVVYFLVTYIETLTLKLYEAVNIHLTRK